MEGAIAVSGDYLKIKYKINYWGLVNNCSQLSCGKTAVAMVFKQNIHSAQYLDQG